MMVEVIMGGVGVDASDIGQDVSFIDHTLDIFAQDRVIGNAIQANKGLFGVVKSNSADQSFCADLGEALVHPAQSCNIFEIEMTKGLDKEFVGKAIHDWKGRGAFGSE